MILCSNVVPQKKTSEVAEAVLKHMKESICKSLGPFGAPTIVATDNADILMTKDGYHIINQIFYNEAISMTFAKIYKDLSRELVSAVGDGSTTCLVAAYHFFCLLKDSIENGILKGVRQKEIMDAVNFIVELLIKELIELAVPVSDDLSEIKALASVSLNNNTELGEMIAGIYKEIGMEGYINVQLGNSIATYTDQTDGFLIQFGRMDEVFVNNDNNESDLRDSAILVFNTSVNSQDQIGYVLNAINTINQSIDSGQDLKYKSLTVIAPGFGSGFVNKLKQAIVAYHNKRRPLNFNLIQYSTSTEFDREMLYDIAIMVGARVITETEKEEGSLINTLMTANEYKLTERIDRIKNGVNPEAAETETADSEKESKKSTVGDYIGYAKKIISSKRSTTFFGGDESIDEIEKEKGRIKAEVDTIKDNPAEFLRKYELNKRYAVLCKKLVTIYVGGYNEANRKSDMELIDDAVNACHSAIENGYVVGGNTAIMRAVNMIVEKTDDGVYTEVQREILYMIKEAFILVLGDVFGNKYDLGSEIENKKVQAIVLECANNYTMYDLIKESYTVTDIINPVDTDIEILKHVTTIISLIMTSNQFITKNANEKIAEIGNSDNLLDHEI